MSTRPSTITSTNSSRLHDVIQSKPFWFGLTLIPIVYVAVYIAVMGLDLPFWDQWAFVPMLARWQEGQLTWAELFSQHNEHRPLFPRLLWLGLAALTGYNTNAEIWLNFVLALATFAVFMRYTASFWRDRGPVWQVTVLLPLFTLLVFNLVQWESWLLGFQTVMYLAMLCVVTGLAALSGWGRQQSPYDAWRNWGVAVVCGTVGLYSMVNVLLYWVLGAGLILLRGPVSGRRYRAMAWMVIGGGLTVGFLRGWRSSGASMERLAQIRPLVYGHWLLNFLGAPLLAYAPAVGLGVLSLGLAGYLAYAHLRNSDNTTLKQNWNCRLGPQGFYWALILFLWGSGLAIGVGRSQGGAYLGLAPRYITLTTWYWAALLAMLVVSQLNRHVLLSVLGLIVALLIASTLGGAISGYRHRYVRTAPVYEAVRSGQPVADAALQSIYSEIPADDLRARIEILCRYGWSACRGE